MLTLTSLAASALANQLSWEEAKVKLEYVKLLVSEIQDILEQIVCVCEVDIRIGDGP